MAVSTIENAKFQYRPYTARDVPLLGWGAVGGFFQFVACFKMFHTVKFLNARRAFSAVALTASGFLDNACIVHNNL